MILALALLLVFALMLTRTVRQMTYPAPPVQVPSPPPDPLAEVRLELPDGVEVVAWTGGGEGLPAGAPVALFFHGNGENLETMRMAGVFDRFRGLGVAVLALDYPGYGRSEGETRESQIISAGAAAWEALERRAPEGCPRILAGWSLGAAVAVQVAAEHPGRIDGLLLLSPWNRLADVAAAHFPPWIVRTLLAEKYDSIESASRWSGPSLVVHGRRDSIIPVALGRELYDALPDPKRWIEIDDAGHNDLLGKEEVWEAMGDWLGEVGT